MVPFSPIPSPPVLVVAELDDGTTNTLLGIRIQAAFQMNAFAFKANVLQGFLSGPAPTAAYTVLKAAASLDNQTTFICAVATNGASPSTPTFTLSGGALPTLTRLNIGNGRTNAVNGWVRRVRYWPRALSNAELQAVTT